MSGYRRDLPSEKLEAEFTEDSRLEITPADIGPTSVVMEGIVGAGVTITPAGAGAAAARRRSASISPSTCFTRSFRDEEGFPKQHLFPQIQRLARRWLDEGYLVTKGVPIGAILYQDQLARAAEKIDIACTRGRRAARILAVLDPYNPQGLDAPRQLHHLEGRAGDRRARRPRATSATSCSTASWEEQLAQTSSKAIRA